MLINEVHVQLKSQDIDFFTKIMEACSHIGIVSTLDAAAGLVVVHVTHDTYTEVLKIITGLPFSAEVVQPGD